MRNKMIMTTLVAVSALLALTDVASAYYSPRLGRFLNRDPINELGATAIRRIAPRNRFIPRDPTAGEGNPFTMVRNRPVDKVDVLGLQTTGSTPSSGIRGPLTQCKANCDYVQSVQPWWSLWSVEECYSACELTNRATHFWSCHRDLKQDGDCPQNCLIAIADSLENHGFLVEGLDPKLKCSCTLQGHEKKGSLPSPEGGFPGKTANCEKCYRRDSVLLYGSGAGKNGYDVSENDIRDCIRHYPARKDYSAIMYNCNDWVIEAIAACGMTCPQKGRGLAGDVPPVSGTIDFPE